MTDIRATRVALEVVENLVVVADIRLTRSALEVVHGLDVVSDVRVTRTAIEVAHSFVPSFVNIDHTEVWSGFTSGVRVR